MPRKTCRFPSTQKSGTEEFCQILVFASAPKLPKDAHKLEGLLSGYTTEIPDDLRTLDFQARQQLQGLLLNHELLEFHKQVVNEAHPNSREPCLEVSVHITNSGCVPLLQTLISNQILIAKKLRHQLRSKAAASVRTHSVRVSLIDGNLFTQSLFDPAAIAKAEDRFQHTMLHPQ